MESTLSVNPFRCRMWWLHERLEESITEESCRAEIRSFKLHGQLVPVLGRRLQGDLTHDVELIYGARRLFVARHLNVPLLVELSTLSDREGVIAMDMENRQRADISAYAQGLSYARWLRTGHFASQEDIARALNVSASQVSRLLKLAQLPRVIVDAFGCALDMSEAWGVQLAKAIGNSQAMERCSQVAREIAACPLRPQPREIYRALLSSTNAQRKPRASAHDRVVKDEDGTSLFKVRSRRDAIALIVPLQRISARCFEDIERAIARILSP